jgi:hypothetical protein
MNLAGVTAEVFSAKKRPDGKFPTGRWQRERLVDGINP